MLRIRLYQALSIFHFTSSWIVCQCATILSLFVRTRTSDNVATAQSKVKALEDFPALVQSGIDDLRSLSMWHPDSI